MEVYRSADFEILDCGSTDSLINPDFYALGDRNFEGIRCFGNKPSGFITRRPHLPR